LIAGIIVGTVVALGYIFSLPNFQKFWYGSASSYQMYYYFIDAGVLAISIVAMILMVLRYKEQ
jgi:nicotinamide riboside transporter PnuC